MRVLITGYSAAGHSSFGSQIRELWSRLAATGEYEIIQHSWFHGETMDGVVPPWQIIPTLRGYDDQGNSHQMANDRYGGQSFAGAIDMVKPDLVWSLADPFMIMHTPELREAFGYKLVVWCPIDGVPVKPKYGQIIRDADLAVGITRWGSDLMSEVAGGVDVPCIYHGVDTALFAPCSESERASFRKSLTKHTDAPEDALLLGWVGRNQFRKMPWMIYPLVYYLNSGHWFECKGCKHITPGPYDRGRRRPLPLPKTCPHCHGEDLVSGRPIKTRLWAHMYQRQGGVQFAYTEKLWGVENCFTYTQGLSQHSGNTPGQMVNLYQMMDVYVSLSGGEGFNIPLIEAASCGTPCIYTDYSGQAEVGRESGGLPVDVASMVTEHHTEMHVDRAVADLGSAIRQILETIGDWPDRTTLFENSVKVRRLAEQKFDWNVIVPQWQANLKQVMEKDRSAKIFGGIA
jgi:glycosyltransferase involved in cell wall biosynthesis